MSKKKEWKMPEYLEQYRELITNTGGNSLEDLMNREGVTTFNNAIVALMISAVDAQIGLLERLHKQNLLK